MTITNFGKAVATDAEIHCMRAPMFQEKLNYSGFESDCFGRLQLIGQGRSYRERLPV